jgi:oligosaccharide repeat unit polymerase
MIRRGGSLLRAYLWASPFISLAFLSGTRFYFMFAATGPVALALIHRPGGRRHLLRHAGVAGFIYFASSVILEFRGTGLLKQDGRTLLSSAVSVDSNHNEGVVRMTAAMIDFFHSTDYRGGQSFLAITTFWVPSDFWADKPPLLGWWLPRAIMGTSKFSPGHSISTGFVGEGYTDFGLIGAYLSAALIGVAIGCLARFTLRNAFRPSCWSVLGALSYPATFFAVRSPDTTAIVMTGAIVWIAAWARRTNNVATSPGGTKEAEAIHRSDELANRGLRPNGGRKWLLNRSRKAVPQGCPSRRSTQKEQDDTVTSSQ